MLKRNSIIFLVVGLLMSATVSAQDLGLGFAIGEPTGFTFKQLRGDNQAIDGGLGIAVTGNGLVLHSDYLWIKPSALYFQESTPLDLYFGIGARMGFDDDVKFGARAPIGLSTRVMEDKAEVFGEFAPILDVVPKAFLSAHLLAGFRYFF